MKTVSGDLDKAEFVNLMKTRMKGTPTEVLEKLFGAFDTDNSGKISFSELATSLSVLSKGTPEEKLKVILQRLQRIKR
jgi:Ca2+-binding EF-hand superfamily protein